LPKWLEADVAEIFDGNLRDLLNESSLAERRAFIRSFVREVTVTGEEVKLNYTIPLPPAEIPDEKLGVLSTTVWWALGDSSRTFV